jgi:hypothetical protein
MMLKKETKTQQPIVGRGTFGTTLEMPTIAATARSDLPGVLALWMEL